VVYDNTKHYLPERLLLYLGHDLEALSTTYYPGQIGYVRVTLGQGAFTPDKKFDRPDDAFGFNAGLNALTD
jgi:hypothetical protein